MMMRKTAKLKITNFTGRWICILRKNKYALIWIFLFLYLIENDCKYRKLVQNLEIDWYWIHILLLPKLYYVLLASYTRLLFKQQSPRRVVFIRNELYCPFVSLIDIYETDKSYHTQHLQSLSFVKSYHPMSGKILLASLKQFLSARKIVT